MSDLAEQVVALEQAVREMRRQRDEQREQLYRAQQACMSWEADLCEMRGKLRVALTERAALGKAVAAVRAVRTESQTRTGDNNEWVDGFQYGYGAALEAVNDEIDAALAVQP